MIGVCKKVIIVVGSFLLLVRISYCLELGSGVVFLME